MTFRYIFSVGIVFILSFSSCRDNQARDEQETDEVQQENEAETMEEGFGEQGEEQDSVLVMIEGNPELSSFATGMNSAEVSDSLNITGNYTVFAPSNDAYSLVYQEQGRDMLDVNSEEVIFYHFVPGEYTVEQLRREIEDADGSYNITTLLGEELAATIEGETVVLEGNSGGRARITETMKATNGMVHVIDAVLLPVEDNPS